VQHDTLLRYGRWELRAKSTAGSGLIFSIFLTDHKTATDTLHEIDMDIPGNRPHRPETSVLYPDNKAWMYAPWRYGRHSFPYDLNLHYHTYWIEWVPDKIRFGLDSSCYREDIVLADGRLRQVFYPTGGTGEEIRDSIFSAADNWVKPLQGALMRFTISLWGATEPGLEPWCGAFTDTSCGKAIFLNWFKYYAFTPGAGTNGSDFTLNKYDLFDGPGWDSTVLKINAPGADVSLINGKAVCVLNCDGAIGAGYSGTVPDDDVDQVSAPVYTLMPTDQPPFIKSLSVSISCATPQVQIYYSTDGSDPDQNDLPYQSALQFQTSQSPVILKSRAYRTGWIPSIVVSDTFVIIDTVAPVTITVADSVSPLLYDSIHIALRCTTTHSSLYYTVDGTTPDSSKSPYTSPFVLRVEDSPVTVKARAYRSGWIPSPIAIRVFEIFHSAPPASSMDTVAAVQISPDWRQSVYRDSLTITLSCSTAGAQIYYAVNDTFIDSQDVLYRGPFTLIGTASPCTLRARAYADGYALGPPSMAIYRFLTRIAPPSIVDPDTLYHGAARIALRVADSSALIYYERDYGVPRHYTKPFFVYASDTLRCWAVVDSQASDTSIFIIRIAIDTMRHVVAEGADTAMIGTIVWRPIGYNYTPAHPQASAVLSALGAGNNSRWRLARWDDGAWDYLTAANAHTFVFSPGTMYWLIAINSINIPSPPGTAAPVAPAFSAPVAPKDWCDFVLPYTFSDGVAFEAITDASVGGPFVFFEFDIDSNAYRLLSSLPSMDIPPNLRCRPGAYYTAYNTAPTAASLVIPPYRQVAKAPAHQPAATGDVRWETRILIEETGRNARTWLAYGVMTAPHEYAQAIPAPAAPDAVVCGFEHRQTLAGYLYRAQQDRESVSEYLSIRNPASSPRAVTIAAYTVQGINDGDIHFVDMANGTVLGDQDQIQIGSGENARLAMFAGSHSSFIDFLESIRAPANISMHMTGTTVVFTVEHPLYRTFNVDIYSLQGKRIMSFGGNVSDRAATADLRRMARGLFVAVITVRNGYGAPVQVQKHTCLLVR